MARPSNTEARRSQIVDGLVMVLSERGYERSSVQAIASAAGLSPGLVHYHFKNKLEILVELVERLDGVLEILGDLPRSARRDSISIPHYVALRSLHSLVAFSETAREVPAVRQLFESVSRDAIEAGPWVVFEEAERLENAASIQPEWDRA